MRERAQQPASGPARDDRPRPRGVASEAGPAPFRLALIVAGCALAAAASGGAAVFLLLGATMPRVLSISPPAAAAAGAALLLGLGAALATGRALSRANGRARTTELVLSLVGSLPPDDPATWQPSRFRERPNLAAFLEAVGGDLTRMRSRMGRRLGLEGELTRLEKCLDDGEGAGDVASYENPSIGRVADFVAQLQERATTAERRVASLEEVRQRLESATGEVGPLLHDALRWNCATLDRISVQEVELERLQGQAQEIAHRLAAGPQAAGADPVADLVAIQKDLAGLGGGEETQDLTRAVRRIDRAAERGSRLAIRAAGEIGRQGAAGEALLPLVQELNDLVADMRAAGSLLEDASPGGGPRLEAIGRRLEQTLAIVRNQGRIGQASTRLAQSAEAVVADLERVTGALGQLPPGFNQQAERLQRAGHMVAEATGREFEGFAGSTPAETESAPDGPMGDPEGGIQIERFDRGGTEQTLEPVIDLDSEVAGAGSPAAGLGGMETATRPRDPSKRRPSIFDAVEADAPIAEPVAEEAAAPAAELVGEPMDGLMGEPMAEPMDVTGGPLAAPMDAPAAGPMTEPTSEPMTGETPDWASSSAFIPEPDPFPAVSPAEAPRPPVAGAGRAASPGLRRSWSSEDGDQGPDDTGEQRVYELSEFDAMALDDEPVVEAAPSEEQDRIHELAEFGAVPLD